VVIATRDEKSYVVLVSVHVLCVHAHVDIDIIMRSLTNKTANIKYKNLSVYKTV